MYNSPPSVLLYGLTTTWMVRFSCQCTYCKKFTPKQMITKFMLNFFSKLMGYTSRQWICNGYVNRVQMGVVSQYPVLFNCSIADNIRYGVKLLMRKMKPLLNPQRFMTSSQHYPRCVPLCSVQFHLIHASWNHSCIYYVTRSTKIDHICPCTENAKFFQP